MSNPRSVSLQTSAHELIVQKKKKLILDTGEHGEQMTQYEVGDKLLLQFNGLARSHRIFNLLAIIQRPTEVVKLQDVTEVQLQQLVGHKEFDHRQLKQWLAHARPGERITDSTLAYLVSFKISN